MGERTSIRPCYHMLALDPSIPRGNPPDLLNVQTTIPNSRVFTPCSQKNSIATNKVIPLKNTVCPFTSSVAAAPPVRTIVLLVSPASCPAAIGFNGVISEAAEELVFASMTLISQRSQVTGENLPAQPHRVSSRNWYLHCHCHCQQYCC